MARFSPEDKETIWDMREAGVPVKRIAKHLGRQNSSLRSLSPMPAAPARRHAGALSCGCP